MERAPRTCKMVAQVPLQSLDPEKIIFPPLQSDDDKANRMEGGAQHRQQRRRFARRAGADRKSARITAPKRHQDESSLRQRTRRFKDTCACQYWMSAPNACRHRRLWTAKAPNAHRCMATGALNRGPGDTCARSCVQPEQLAARRCACAPKRWPSAHLIPDAARVESRRRGRPFV